MPVINPEHLLDQAARLIKPSGGGALRQADLRRAISSAYYGIFHAVVTEAADDFVGAIHRNSIRYSLLYRSIDHRWFRELCENIAKPKLPARYAKYEPANGFGQDLKNLANAVVELQEKRHTADYDPLYRANRSDALLAITTGRTALASFRNSNLAQRRVFLSLLVFSPR